PILQNRCQVCHHPGTAAPFSLLTREDMLKHLETIREAVQDERMPPWSARADYGYFANDRRLLPSEKRLLLDWIDSGQAAGNPGAPPPPREWEEGWMIGKPDVIIDMPGSQEIPATGFVDYQYFSGKIPFSKDLWIVAAELQPGCRKAVHHAQLYTRGLAAI